MNNASTIQSWVNIFSALSLDDFDIICDAVDVVKDMRKDAN
jgi:hypothetical protein